MMLVAFDTETFLIDFVLDAKGKPCGTRMLAPRLVCGSWATDSASGLMNRPDVLLFLQRVLRDKSQLLVGHNIAYDLGVCCAEDPSLLPLVFKALSDGRISDTKIRQQLIDIAQGELEFRTDPITQQRMPAKNSLADLVKLHLHKHLEKEDTWRLRYSELDGVPLDKWPEEAKSYALTDAKSTLQVYQAQEKFAGDIPNEREQVQAAFALHLISMWGMRTDGAMVAKLKETLEAEREAASSVLKAVGIMREDGSKDTKKIQAMVYTAFKTRGIEPPRTEKKGEVQIGEDVLMETGHPHLVTLAQSMSGMKILSTYVPILEARSKGAVGCSYNVLVASGRTSSSKPNDQNPPRKGGVRECYVPRAGNVFVFCDYDTLELRAWSQVLLDLVGWSKMAEALRRGEDLHLSLAAEILGISPEDALRRHKQGDVEVAEWRQQCKVANFGFPGGMSARTFVQYCLGQGLPMELDLAGRLHAAWKKRWPEYQPYFDKVQSILGASGTGTVEQLRSGRIRGGLSFCEAANTYFQGLAADGAKAAVFNVAAQQYVERSSPLFGARTVAFLHDEIGMEVVEARAHDAAMRLRDVMVDSMQRFIPDVPVTASPVAMRRWYKGAKPVYVDGRLVPSKPETKMINGKVVHQWIEDRLPDLP